MSRADLHEAVEQPAVGAGFRLEDGLVDAVLEDAGSEPAALPLVSHAMAETWRRRDGDTLTLAGYREAGGVAGSISQTADALYETVFDDTQRDACRRLMLRLVTSGEGSSDTRRRVFMRELDSDHDPEISRKVAADMVDARLLTVDRDSLEIAHEALLQSWPRLRSWIDEGRDDLRTRQRVSYAAAEWSADDRDPDLLYRGTPLQATLEWAAGHDDILGLAEEAFLAASRDAWLREKAQLEGAAKRSRRLRRTAVSFLILLAIAAVVASIVAFSALGQARSRFGQALATQATGLTDSDPLASIALAVEAMARGQSGSIEARSALVDASESLAAAKFVPSGSGVSVGDASTVAVSPDGQLIVTGNRDGSISTWGPTGGQLTPGANGHAKAIEEMDFTPDGRWLVSGSDDGTILLWDLADPTDIPVPTLLGDTGQIVWSVAVAPDGRTVATASEDGTIQLWNLEEARKIGPQIADLGGDALTVAFSPDGELLLAGNGVGEVTGWRVADRRIAIPTFNAHKSDVWEIEFTPDGSRFATASSDGRIRVWDTATRNLLAEPFARSADDVRGVLIDDKDVLAGDEEGRLLIAPMDTKTRPTVSASQHDAQIVDAAWAADTLVTLGNDQQMQLWARGGDPTALVIAGQTAGAFGLAVSPDGTRIATGDGEGNVRIFSTATGKRELGPIRLHEGIVWSLA
ncbi:MAG: WD40 repeat domain-containing protein, partial [Candidatus Dormibacteraeota bacterium]|nr:WD40 repeat domain-containing protein [Candidatus Dormibacteraeota bacterium]